MKLNMMNECKKGLLSWRRGATFAAILVVSATALALTLVLLTGWQVAPVAKAALDGDQAKLRPSIRTDVTSVEVGRAIPLEEIHPSADDSLIAAMPPPEADPQPVEVWLSAQATWADMTRFDRIRAIPIGEVDETLAPPLVTNFGGTIDNNLWIPPDTMGAVGPNHVAEILNSGFQVFDKTGLVVAPQVTLQAFWAALGTAAGQPASRPFDPKILFDQYSSRYVVTSDGNPNNRDGTNNSWVLVGISQTNDPTLGWNLYAIQSNVGVHTSDWSDYPGLGVDPDNVVITNNMFTVCLPSCSAYVHADVWVISKAAMIAGGPLVLGGNYSVFHNPCGTGGSTFQPCHTFGQNAGNAINYIVDQGWLDLATRMRRFLRIKAITGTGAGAILVCPAGGADFIEVAPYNFNQLDAPQASCSTAIETNDTRLLNAVWRNEKVWTTHSVGVGFGITDTAPPSKTEVAWYELNPAVAGACCPGVMGTPIQQGRVSHPDTYYYFPSIAVNRVECVALGFSGSDESIFASGYYTLRQPLEPLGTMQPVSLLKAGVGPYWKQFGGTRNRWGDYSATMVDPVDDETFWTVQEYAEVPFTQPAFCVLDDGRWGTWWGSFECKVTEAKFRQPLSTSPTEDVASDIDLTDMFPNIVVADDFQSDGRPITCVRWWGSYFSLASEESDTNREVFDRADKIAVDPVWGPEDTGMGVPLETAGDAAALQACGCDDCANLSVDSCNNSGSPPCFDCKQAGTTCPCVVNDLCTNRLPCGAGCPPGQVCCPNTCCGTPLCWNICNAPATCGNGLVEPGEQCDPPDGITCDAFCQCLQVTGRPNLDGWLISFHEPIVIGSQGLPLGLYFCPEHAIQILPLSIAACDNHDVFEYFVELKDCCLLHSNMDSRSGFFPADPDLFDEEECFYYDIDIQAVVGYTYTRTPSGMCTPPFPTNRQASNHFWGWHTTTIEAGIRKAVQSMVTMGGGQWFYGPWNFFTPTCSPANMAFELYTTQPASTQACCFPTAPCQDLLPLNCCANGGIPKGVGTSCATTSCFICGNGICDPGEDQCNCPNDCNPGFCGDNFCCAATGETTCTCPADCGSGSCGDNICCGASGETTCTCPADCGPELCGDGFCCAAAGETTCTCPIDCGLGSCGDGVCCAAAGETTCTCPVDCGLGSCGDGVCCAATGETTCTCPVDCGPSVCGDGFCCAAAGETTCMCPIDCGLPPANETNCTDGLDNDCDGTTDCGDPDCAPVCCPPSNPPNPDPTGIRKNRFISFVGTNPGRNTALRVTLNAMPAPFGGFVGAQYWVGPPAVVSEISSISGPAPLPTFNMARLQCAPHCRDWSTVGLVHVSDDEIIPVATYDVQAIDCACNLTNPANYSAVLSILTAVRCGDIVPIFGVIDFIDIGAMVDKFQNLPGAVIKTRADLMGNIVNRVIDFIDIGKVVDSFRGIPCVWTGPCLCPGPCP